MTHLYITKRSFYFTHSVPQLPCFHLWHIKSSADHWIRSIAMLAGFPQYQVPFSTLGAHVYFITFKWLNVMLLEYTKNKYNFIKKNHWRGWLRERSRKRMSETEPRAPFLLKLSTCKWELCLFIQIVSLTLSLGLYADPSEKLIPVPLSVFLHTMPHSQCPVRAHVTPAPDVLNSPPPSTPLSGEMLVAGLCPKPNISTMSVKVCVHSRLSGNVWYFIHLYLNFVSHFWKTPPDSLSATYLFCMPNPSENICQSTQILA